MDDLVNAIAPMILIGIYAFLLCVFPPALLFVLAWLVVVLVFNAFMEGDE
jgi:hypothetical protein